MYSPLANGATIKVFKSTPIYPISLLADSRCTHHHPSPAMPWPRTMTSAACTTLAVWASPSAQRCGIGTTNTSLSSSARLWIPSGKLYICCEVH